MDRLSYDTVLARDLAAIPARAYHDRLFLDMLLAVWSRRGLVLAVLLMSIAVGAGALALLPRKYAAEAIVQLDLGAHEGIPLSGQAQLTGQAQPVALEGAAVIQSEAKIIRSRMIARRVVDRLGLVNDPAFARREGLSTRFLAWISGTPDDPARTASAHLEAAENALTAATKVETDLHSYLISVGATTGRPDFSARLANAVADAYLQWRREANRDTASRMVDRLAGQIESTTKALREAEGQADSYRSENDLPMTPDRGESLLQQQIRNLAAQFAAVSADRANLQARSARVEGLARSGQVPSATDLQASPVIRTLIQREAAARNDLSEKAARLGPGHPDVLRARAALAELSVSIAAAVKQAVAVRAADLAVAQQNEQDLAGQLETLRQAEIVRTNEQARLRELQGNVQLAKDRLANLIRDRDQALAVRDLPTGAALDRLRENSVVVDGVVVTRVDLRRHAVFRSVDPCFYYVKDRRVFDRLSADDGACTPDQPRTA